MLCNACFLIVTRVQQAHVVSGVDESSLAALKLTGYDPANAVDLNARVLSGVGRIPGVQSISVINAVPFGDHAGTAGIRPMPKASVSPASCTSTSAARAAFQALGLHLVAGGHAAGW